MDQIAVENERALDLLYKDLLLSIQTEINQELGKPSAERDNLRIRELKQLYAETQNEYFELKNEAKKARS